MSSEKIEEALTKETLKNDKPYFFPRLVAYIIDVTLVSIVCSGILFLFPKNENYSKYLKEYQEVQTNFIDNKIEADEYIHKVADITYDIDYSNVLSMIVEVVLLILYFIVFQFYNKGQTFGKKLMKLRVVNNNGNELTLNQVTCRALIIDSILINLFMIAALLFSGRNYYYYASLSLQLLSGIIIFVTLMMIFFRKDGRGLHDVVTGTKVIQEN
ncbi:RDD family protein [bacterium]|nr:RDD family protein [bacterium]